MGGCDLLSHWTLVSKEREKLLNHSLKHHTVAHSIRCLIDSPLPPPAPPPSFGLSLYADPETNPLHTALPWARVFQGRECEER